MKDICVWKVVKDIVCVEGGEGHLCVCVEGGEGHLCVCGRGCRTFCVGMSKGV